MRPMNRLGNLEKESPEDGNLVEPVVSEGSIMWGWPEEERWYNLELCYKGQGKVVLSANIGIVTDCVSKCVGGRRTLGGISMNCLFLALRPPHSSVLVVLFYLSPTRLFTLTANAGQVFPWKIWLVEVILSLYDASLTLIGLGLDTGRH